MREFLLVFRRDHKTPDIQPSPEELTDWFRNLAAQNKLAHPI